ncbi:MAG TPA: VPLPA-CTERM sorting domain-containing protein [Steroidobacteraceae bacterium]|nr:VPLPA-CTERM sorting domain-containing protein [Steroidobacteraceae bacterium]
MLNEPYNEAITVELLASTGVVGGGTGSASADPSIYFLNSTDAADYSLVFSDGIGNPAPVPLPAAVWLLLSGLAGLGGVGTCVRSNLRRHGASRSSLESG